MLTTRRQALKTITAAALASTALGHFSASAEPVGGTPAAPAHPTGPGGPFTLPALPYAYDALEPHIDAETMHLHHDKHHAGYVAKLNEAVAKDKPFELSLGSKPDVDVQLRSLAAVPETIRLSVRNQGGGHSNHSLFWQTLSKKGGKPVGELATGLEKAFGGLEAFKAEAAKAGAGVFGSGWVWLTLDGAKKLAIETSPNQDTPVSQGKVALFGIDVWEHAYYLKYHNLRADYITALWNVVNWDFISDRYAKALKG